MLEINKIYNGDCLDLMSDIDNKSIDLVITDPPYGVLKIEWDLVDLEPFTRQWLDMVLPKMADNSAMYVFWSQKYLRLGLDIFNPKRMLIWHHPNLAKNTNSMYLWTYDPIFYIVKGKPVFNASFSNKDNVDVLRYAKPQSNYKRDKRRHPAQKPFELCQKFVRVSSNKNALVLDPFMGSGTTCDAAKSLERNYIGIEKEIDYYKSAEERLNVFNV